MRILVTGGAGFVGSVAVKSLLERGNDVVVIDNLAAGHAEAISNEVAFHRIDYSPLIMTALLLPLKTKE